jgi:hypothetical protein
MIRLSHLLTEVNKEFTAKSKDSGKLVHFKSKESYEKAIKAGSHEDPTAKTSKGDDKKGGVNIFNTPTKSKTKPAETSSNPISLKYSKDGKMTQDSADSIEKELNAELGVSGMADINSDTGTIEYFISDDSDEAIFIGKEEGGKGIAVSFGDGGDEYKTFKNSKDAIAYAKELGNQLKG